MFKPGEKVVCISNEYASYKLKLYEIYTIHYISGSLSGKTIDYIVLVEDIYRHRPSRFISVKEYRKQKLKKICSSI